MTDKKLKEVSEDSLKGGKYLGTGKPIVIRTIACTLQESRNHKKKETEFQGSLEKLAGSISIPHEAEFFVRGHPSVHSADYGNEFEYKEYTPVQFYKTAKFNVSVS